MENNLSSEVNYIFNHDFRENQEISNNLSWTWLTSA